MPDAIVVDHLTYTYGDEDHPALRDVSFSLAFGETLGVIGPNESGKTTLARALMGLIPNTMHGDMQGKVQVAGLDTQQSAMGELVRHVGLVFQEPEVQLSQMTVEEEVAYGLGNLGVPREEMHKRIEDVLGTVGLTGMEKRNPTQLSGGQQQRLAIASVLAMGPEVIIFDEPTSMLDPAGKNEVFSILRKLRDANATGVIIEHEIERVALFCDKVLALKDGAVVAFGSPTQVFERASELESQGVRVPQVSELAGKLAGKGLLPANTTYTTADEAVTELSRRMGKGG
jgi:energy-coupling factor transport system ATP-binding protein